MKRLSVALAAALALLVTAGGCSRPSVLLHRPEDKVADMAVTSLWQRDIARVAQDGDWILSRGYYMTSDVIATLTAGEDLSHAAIYDAKRGTVIESVGSGVREIPLAKFLQRNAHVIVVRPSGMTVVQRERSVSRARSRLGAGFDSTGLVGIDNRDKVYCSELVWWASQGELRTGVHERVITPAELMSYGQVVYWSGERDDQQIQSVALEQSHS